MDFLEQLKEISSVYIPTFRLGDIVEIFILIYLIHKVIKGLKNTRAKIVLKGIFILFMFYNIAYLLNFDAILVIFQSVLTILLFAVIIVFQPEIRKFIESIGKKNIVGDIDILSLFKKDKEVYKYYSDKSIVELSKACFSMGEVKTGALIVLERDIPLTEYIETGLETDSTITSQLIINMFEKNTPMHDGAMIIVKDRIAAATCYLPLTKKTNINKKLGTRHRAAVGASEFTDAVVIIVSEETGNVSLSFNGKIEGNLTKEKLTELLYKYQRKEEVTDVKQVTEKVKFKFDKFSLKKLFSKDEIVTTVASIVVGVVGWILLMNVSNPMTSVVFENVPIEVINTQVIESTGKTFEITSEEFVDVEVTASRSVVDRVSKDDIKVVADLTKLSYVNAVLLQAHVDGSPNCEVKFLSGDTITVELDSIVSKEVPIVLERYSELSSSTFVPVLYSDVEKIILTGGKTKIDTVEKVVYTYDTTEATGVFEGSAEPIVYDRNGNELPNEFFTFDNYEVKAFGQSYPIKEIPINIELNQKVIGGYRVDNFTFEPQNVRLACDKDRLSSLDVLKIKTNIDVDLSSVTNNEFVKSVKISDYLPDGVYFAGENDEVILTIHFESLNTKTITFSKEDVTFKGLGNGLEPFIEDSSFSIVVSGEDSQLEVLTKDNIRPFIDVSTLSVGKYNMIMQFEGLDNVTLTSNISVILKIVNKE